jgi:lysylphosphatidylglycerol synthetase-like protein (DUF2156 family)
MHRRLRQLDRLGRLVVLVVMAMFVVVVVATAVGMVVLAGMRVVVGMAIVVAVTVTVIVLVLVLMFMRLLMRMVAVCMSVPVPVPVPVPAEGSVQGCIDRGEACRVDRGEGAQREPCLQGGLLDGFRRHAFAEQREPLDNEAPEDARCEASVEVVRDALHALRNPGEARPER